MSDEAGQGSDGSTPPDASATPEPPRTRDDEPPAFPPPPAHGRDSAGPWSAPGQGWPAGGGPQPQWGFPHPAGQPTVPPYAGTPYAYPGAQVPGAWGFPQRPGGGGGAAMPPYDADSGPVPGFGYGGPPPQYPPLPYAFAVEEPPEPREPMRWTWRAAAGLALIALAAGVLGGGLGAMAANRGEERVTLRQPASSGPERPRDTIAGLAASTLPGVVYIHASKGGKQATGTGFVLDGNGFILTNNHVVADAADGGQIRVVFNGGEMVEGRVVGRDAGYDLAVVRVENVRGLAPLALGDSDTVQVGDPVIAIGAPYNLEGTVTSGIISAKDRAVSAGGSGADVSYISALQTDAPINPGNSGGPLIDASGRVIGVNSAIRSAGEGGDSEPFGSEQGVGSIGLGFAIPINQAKRVAQQLIDRGKAVHPVMGVSLDVKYTGPGARVSDKDNEGQPPVRPGGPADRAGLKPGDVVTAIDGKRVDDAEELIVAVRSKAPGDQVALTVQRDGKDVELKLTLEGEDS
ncbi:S1C family serine protease [Yinghuangia soli]|uniref:Trypsin-like peptidase domain-containing protein n=1 Tax=Yinghuangia soli TaxID=2908204 RepID=A0AA41U6F4_9ACTN|nr:trypsin-like peptidase domain-containing protein [Yinghuangia soli]MCF2532922.1 trypsin-like peptidase domain-containing protein [Yinghuangia soli]